MTKRFQFKFNDGEYVHFYIIDNETGIEYKYLIDVDDELIKLLKELAEENEQLKSDNKDYVKRYSELFDEYKKNKKENEQLQKELTELKASKEDNYNI